MRKFLLLVSAVSLAALGAYDGPARADDAAQTKPACLRVNSINGWRGGDEKTVGLDTAGRRYRVTFREPCLGKEKSIGMSFGLRVGSYCLEPGDELIFTTIGGSERSCFVAKIELLGPDEKIVPAPPVAPPQP